ncbi:MAG TPA: phosphotransferase, partial [Kofleriaceae bacterium]
MLEAIMNLEACLPPELQGPATTIDRIAVGASGAGVYRVEAAGQTFVLKVAAEVEPVEAWHGKVRSYRRAADAGLAPRVVHVDDERRAIVSAFVADRSFPALFATPETRQAALALLGRTLRRVHALPLPPDAASTEPREFLAQLWSALASFALPGFVGSAVQRVTAEEPPARERAVVLS